MHRVAIGSLVVAVVSLAACGGGGDDSSGNLTGTFNCSAPSNGTFSATINGASWSACQVVAVRRDSTISGKDTTRSIGIAGTGGVSGNLTYALVISVTKIGPLAAGTFPTGVLPSLSSVTVGSSTSAGWAASFGTGSGTVTITSITSHQVTGTFTADAAPVTGAATGTLQIRNGTFNLSY